MPRRPQNGIQPEMSLIRALVLAPLFFAGMFMLQGTPASAQTQSAPAATSMHTNSSAPAPELPDAPTPCEQASSTAVQPTAPEEGEQTKRILVFMPNFLSVSTNCHPPAQTPKEKFIGFAQNSFDYSSFVFVGMLAGISQLQGSTPEFHTGAPAYARYYWHTFVDQTDENLLVGFLLPVALHQDPRYYTLGSGTENQHNGFVKRAGYAFTPHSCNPHRFRRRHL